MARVPYHPMVDKKLQLLMTRKNNLEMFSQPANNTISIHMHQLVGWLAYYVIIDGVVDLMFLVFASTHH